MKIWALISLADEQIFLFDHKPTKADFRRLEDERGLGEEDLAEYTPTINKRGTTLDIRESLTP